MAQKTKDELKKLIKNLAKEAVESFVREGLVIKPALKHPFLLKPAASFVSLKIENQLRGCLGTIEPQKPTLAEEIVSNAIKAASEDYRFHPVETSELGYLQYCVDVLSKLEPVEDTKELNPKKYGILVKKGIHQGLLLPDLEGVNTIEQQLDIAMHKAGIFSYKGLKIFKFEVRRF